MATPMEIINNPFLNKGTGFTKKERAELGLTGLIPPQVQTIQEQADQAYAQVQSKGNDLEKRLFLMQIFNTNHTLFYYLFSQHVVEFMPIVYDPTIADSIENYSELFVDSQNAVYLSIDEQDDLEGTLKRAAAGRDIKIIVVTDGEGILGIGDWGTNGVDISVGKLMVYTAAAGINPENVLPVVLDVGTNRESLLQDPMYLGNKHKRVRGDEYDAFVDKFVAAALSAFPDLYLHWEDFGRMNAAKILKKYQNKITTFNDDIQGTGIITLAGIIGALKISKQRFTDQTYLCFGAGSAGAGITNRIFEEMVQEGLSEDEARKHFYMFDKQGLLFDDMDDLTPEQKPFARKRSEFENANQLKDLLSVVKAVHPTILVGTSTVPGSFTEEVVREMAAHTERPIIFPLSNPTRLAEAKAEDLLQWTDGKALIATGIPVKPIEYKGVTYHIGQANNALIYPGLGLGVIASSAKVLNDEMISAAAHSLGGIVDPSEQGAAVLPPVSKLTEFSELVAIATGQSAIDQGITKDEVGDVKQAIAAMKWVPEY
ncbi:malolactic enzyme [Eupransor demetentiae]|uniref:Malic enzyme (SfcA) n=1 Tax=Eupransor demetentiae TaxID=3109584 RepID=A0ABP0ETH5_9LACO|nr:Malic enzyme (SfcA) [Lactobacillaceae bacterium LMG 33000]